MLTVIGRRLVWAAPNLIFVTVLLFFSVAVFFGNPAALMLGQDATPQAIAELSHQMGFDRPVVVQYLSWVGHALTGDLGRSYTTHQTVAEMMLRSLPVTIELAVLAILLATIVSVGLSSLTWGQRAIAPLVTVLSIIGMTVPNFMLGMVAIFIFSVKLGWLPSVGWVPWDRGLFVHLEHLILPTVTLAAYYFGAFTLVYRAEYQAVRDRLFVRVARAKGLSAHRVSFRHVLPNSILPVITYIGISLGQLMGGAVVTETLFSMPGIGKLFVTSILSRDYPVMLAVGMFIIVAVIVMNLLADVVYTLINPQIRLN
ncbi:ABC transporter permease [Caballeronia sp. LZ008]|uniref:ABC transporter permease n=1 Tax=unclassified Caballeronia TaxID=2646786 RepID=UPI0020295BA4|nr:MULTISPECIES: ABC transporter permease [unclassified Caballeronia]MDR5798155.1 ABC transporter permease [Caballeronia sp. LZ008]